MASSTVKQHIAVALDEGIEAGFDSWYESLVTNTNDGTNGLPQLRTLLADVRKAGKRRGRKGTDRAKQIAFYCNKYANDLGEIDDDEGTTTTTTTVPTTNDDPIAALSAQVASLQASLTALANGETPVVEDDDEPEIPAYTGKDPDAPASSGQLYRLNELGLLTPSFTKAEAHDAIARALLDA